MRGVRLLKTLVGSHSPPVPLPKLSPPSGFSLADSISRNESRGMSPRLSWSFAIAWGGLQGRGYGQGYGWGGVGGMV